MIYSSDLINTDDVNNNNKLNVPIYSRQYLRSHSNPECTNLADLDESNQAQSIDFNHSVDSEIIFDNFILADCYKKVINNIILYKLYF